MADPETEDVVMADAVHTPNGPEASGKSAREAPLESQTDTDDDSTSGDSTSDSGDDDDDENDGGMEGLGNKSDTDELDEDADNSQLQTCLYRFPTEPHPKTTDLMKENWGALRDEFVRIGKKLQQSERLQFVEWATKRVEVGQTTKTIYNHWLAKKASKGSWMAWLFVRKMWARKAVEKSATFKHLKRCWLPKKSLWVDQWPRHYPTTRTLMFTSVEHLSNRIKNTTHPDDRVDLMENLRHRALNRDFYARLCNEFLEDALVDTEWADDGPVSSLLLEWTEQYPDPTKATNDTPKALKPNKRLSRMEERQIMAATEQFAQDVSATFCDSTAHKRHANRQNPTPKAADNKVTAELRQVRETNDKIIAELQQAREANDKMTDELQQVLKANDEKKAEYSQLVSTIAGLRTELRQARDASNVVWIRSGFHALREQFGRVEAKLDQTQKAFDGIKSEVEDLKQSNTSLGARVSRLQETGIRVENVQQDLRSVVDNHDQLKLGMRQLGTQLMTQMQHENRLLSETIGRQMNAVGNALNRNTAYVVGAFERIVGRLEQPVEPIETD